MTTPAPATLHLPPPRVLREPKRQAPRATVVEAPGETHQVDIELLLARVTIKGVAGVSSSAVAEYVAILQRDLATSTRLAKASMTTDWYADDEEHDDSCLCRECLQAERDEERDQQEAERTVRLNAPTLPAPASIDDALESVLDDSMHDPSTCTDPCCVEDDEDEHPLFVSEADAVLSDARGFYGVSSGGAW